MSLVDHELSTDDRYAQQYNDPKTTWHATGLSLFAAYSFESLFFQNKYKHKYLYKHLQKLNILILKLY
jgi:hypothetical protein